MQCVDAPLLFKTGKFQFAKMVKYMFYVLAIFRKVEFLMQDKCFGTLVQISLPTNKNWVVNLTLFFIKKKIYLFFVSQINRKIKYFVELLLWTKIKKRTESYIKIQFHRDTFQMYRYLIIIWNEYLPALDLMENDDELLKFRSRLKLLGWLNARVKCSSTTVDVSPEK